MPLPQEDSSLVSEGHRPSIRTAPQKAANSNGHVADKTGSPRDRAETPKFADSISASARIEQKFAVLVAGLANLKEVCSCLYI
jgi:hypothetical protein